MAEKEKNIHANHRQRMKAEFLARGLDGWPEHRVLEFLLFFAIPQGDVNPLAHRLIDHFQSLDRVFAAPYKELLTVPGVGRHTATLIKLAPALASYYLRGHASPDRIYQTSWDFRELLLPEFFCARNELVYLVCMDGKHQLLADPEKIGEGIADAASITTRKVMETALGHNASVVALAHNHVSGIAMPSAEDIMTTKQLARSLRQVGILLYDHFIVADGDMVSMRESGYLAD